MKKRIFTTLFFLFAGLAVIYCQPTNSDLSNALASLGISSGLATVIVTVLAVMVGKFIPQKWADPLALIIKFAKVLIVVLEWLNDKINNGAKEQKFAINKGTGEKKKKLIVPLKDCMKNAWRYIGVIVLLFALPLASQAQSPFHGFFKPVTQENFSLLKGTGDVNQFLVRPTVGISATQTYFVDKQIKTEPLVGAGVGVSYLHFKDVTTEPYNDYGVNAMALFNMTDAGNVTVSPAVTFNYQKVSAGAGYNFADKRLFILTGITLTFN